jgi:predicted RNA binding protein YcfA (HicA-like mRNA interferase family)
MCAKFRQKLIAKGWVFKCHGKGSHELWFHPRKGTVSISRAAMNDRVSKAIERRLFELEKTTYV